MGRSYSCWIALVLLGIAAAGAQPPAAPADPEAVLQAVVELVAEERLDEAVARLEELRDADGATPPALALLGALYVETGRPLEALAALRPLAEAENTDPAVLYNAGRAAIAIGQLAAGEQFLRRAVEWVPDSPAARELGLLLARQGRFFDAYVQLRPWARGHLDDQQAVRIAALCAIQLGRASEAEAFLETLPQERPEVRLLRGRLLLLQADPHAAVAVLEPLLAEAPAAMELDVRRTLAEAHATLGKAAEAVRLLQGRAADNPSASLQLALAQYQSGDLDGALATLEPFAKTQLERLRGNEAGGEDRTALGIIREYGRLLVTAGRHQEAVAYLHLATEREPENKQAWQQLGQALAATGDREGARAAVERFREIVENEVPSALQEMELRQDLEDPTGREVRQAFTLASKGRLDEALAILEREAAVAPEDLRPRLMQVRLLQYADRPLEAYALAQELLEAAPDNADVRYLRGTTAIAVGELAEAENELRKALELSPFHTAAMNDLAVLLMEKGENDEARELLERALEFRPDDEVAAGNLERLEQQ